MSFMRGERKYCAALAGVILSIAGIAKGSVIVSSSGNSGSTALQIPSVVATSPWTMAYDPSTPAGSVTATSSKGLYTQSAGITSSTNMTWANLGSTPYGIQLLLPHTAGTAAVLGLGALNSSATFDPANVDGSTLGIDNISMSLTGGQTSTPNDSGEFAFLLVQNGNYYRTQWTVVKGVYSNQAANNVSFTGLTAASFGKITITRLGTDGGNTDFLSNPDFSPTGKPIELGWLAGYDSSLGTTDANNRTIVTSWSATVTGVQAPEPAAISSLALAMTLFSRRRGTRSST